MKIQRNTPRPAGLWRLILLALLLLLAGMALVAVGILRIGPWALKLLAFVLAAALMAVGGLFLFSLLMTARISRASQRRNGRADGGALPRVGRSGKPTGNAGESEGGSGKRNFFLFDPAAKQNIPPEELTKEQIADRVMLYMNTFAKRGRLDIALLFAEGRGAVPAVFRPLFVYRLLLKLAQDGEDATRSFLACGKSMVDAFAGVLPDEDETLLRQLQKSVALFRNGKDPDAAARAFRAYVVGRREWLGERMLSYVRAHLNEFEIESV